MPDTIAPYLAADGTFVLDVGRTRLNARTLDRLRPALDRAFDEMAQLEGGAVKNIDEQRRVTHFTDRIGYPQTPLFEAIESFFAELRAGRALGSTGRRFEHLVMNGIGGSALGPQMVHFALNGPYWNELSTAQRGGAPRLYFTDNTDAAGVVDILAVVDLAATLVVTVSKSGSTQETANNMVAFEAAFAAAGLDFGRHAAAITMAGSRLDAHARANRWLHVWPMAESIGGRTSETAVVGHVPAAAAGVNFRALLEGACTMDAWTREPDVARNPAYLLAAVWHAEGGGRGDRNMVIVPYSDRLVLLSRYLQQLVMESLGKERDRRNAVVHQGLTVFGNKGGTDAHAFMQQLNDGRDDFFVTFIEILRDVREMPVDAGLSMGNYLHNFLQGLVNALGARGRSVVRMTFAQLDARTLGMIIALYERAVAVYAELIDINAFHQPGVQAYKKMSQAVNALTVELRQAILDGRLGEGTAGDFAAVVGTAAVGDVAGILDKLAVNRQAVGDRVLRRELEDGRWRYRTVSSA